MTKYLLSLLLSLFCFNVFSEYNYTGFEGSVPSNWTATNGTLSISDTHYKLGSQSMKWDFSAGGYITVNNPVNISQALTEYKGGIVLWVYSEEAKDKEVIFEFTNSSGVVHYWFNYKINFTGWRACWLRFDDDMKGIKGTNDITQMKISAPDDTNGTLFFDRYGFQGTRIADRVTADAQLPYINPSLSTTNHWAQLWFWEDNFTYDLPLQQPTAQELTELANIKTNLINSVEGSAPSESSSKDQYYELNIVKTGDQITGVPLIPEDYYLPADGEVCMHDVGVILNQLARLWYHQADNEARLMYYNTLDYAIDQGMAYGSCMGTNHHYGYQYREYATSIVLMEQDMIENGTLEKYHKHFDFWAGLAEFRHDWQVDELQGLIDSWNTMTIPRLAAIVTIADDAERAQAMRGMLRWYDNTLIYSSGTKGGFKPDGSGFHHYGLYPAYSVGAFSSLGEYVSLLDGSYQLNDVSRQTFKEALLAIRFYSNKTDWGFGLSGRHPLGGTMGSAVINAFYNLAMAGDNVGDGEIDEELGAAYMRYVSSGTEYSTLYNSGIRKEESPTGFKEMNHGAVGLFRRNDWLVTVKGYNQVAWNSEIYTADNRFGRYQSYGTVQIMHEGGSNASRFYYDGWNWNRYPGATSIQLPFDLLESPKSTTLTERSVEKFAGASSFDSINGMFAMVLNEGNYTNYTDDHKAYKSVFCFGDFIVCIGTDISNSNSTYPTETTLFQNGMEYSAEKTFGGYADATLAQYRRPEDYELDGSKDMVVSDILGNGYYIKAGDKVVVHRNTQVSLHDKTEEETGSLDPTTGTYFCSAVIEHGYAPQGKSYEYVVLPEIIVLSNRDDIDAFSLSMASPETEPYTTLQKNSDAHIINHKETNITGYSIFTPNTDIDKGVITKASNQCMIMYKPSDENLSKLKLTVCIPDLNLSQESGEIAESSKPSSVDVTIQGEWIVDTNDALSNFAIKNYNYNGEEVIETVFTVTCYLGMTSRTTLVNQGNPLITNNLDSNINFNISKINNNLIIESKLLEKYSGDVSVMNIQGKTIAKYKSVKGFHNSLKLKNNITNGIYIVNVTANNEKYTQKIKF